MPPPPPSNGKCVLVEKATRNLIILASPSHDSYSGNNDYYLLVHTRDAAIKGRNDSRLDTRFMEKLSSRVRWEI